MMATLTILTVILFIGVMAYCVAWVLE
jgi:hypothetical protein